MLSYMHTSLICFTGSFVLSDPRLAYQLYFGPCCPYQYRLQGPHSWSGARHALMTVMERVHKPFETRRPDGTQPLGFWSKQRLDTIVVIAAVLICQLIALMLWMFIAG